MIFGLIFEFGVRRQYHSVVVESMPEKWTSYIAFVECYS
jgi:hypothetical protein